MIYLSACMGPGAGFAFPGSFLEGKSPNFSRLTPHAEARPEWMEGKRVFHPT